MKETNETQSNPRNYSIEHYKIALSVDLYLHMLTGFVDIHIKALNEPLSRLRLHTEQIEINGVHLDQNQPCKVKYHDMQPVDHLIDTEIPREMGKKYRSLKSSDVIYYQESTLSNLGRLEILFKTPLAVNSSHIIRIYYSLQQPHHTVYFQQAEQTNQPYMYITNNACGARAWFPCVDEPGILSTFEFEITSHRNSEVICPGIKITEYENKSHTIKTVVYRKDDHRITPQNVTLIVGPFKQKSHPYREDLTLHYLPPFPEDVIEQNAETLHEIIEKIEDLLNVKLSNITDNFKIVFIEDPYMPLLTFSSVCIVNIKYIVVSREIEKYFESILQLATAICEQFSTGFLVPATYQDSWLTYGIAGWLALKFYQERFGLIEFKWHLLKFTEELRKYEDYSFPLTRNFGPHQLFPFHIPNELAKKKAGVVVYMLEKQFNIEYLGHFRGSFEIFLDPNNADNRVIHGQKYLEEVMAAFSKDTRKLKQFLDYWVYSTGIPEFIVGSKYAVNKSNIHQIAIEQKNPIPGVALYSGKLHVVIQEDKGDLSKIEVNIDNVYTLADYHLRNKDTRITNRSDTSGPNDIKVPIKYIRVDPDMSMIRSIQHSQKFEDWMHQFELDEDPIGKLEALTYISKMGHLIRKKDAELMITKIKTAKKSETETYFRVKVEAIKTLAYATNRDVQVYVYEQLYTEYKSTYYDQELNAFKSNVFEFQNIDQYYLKQGFVQYFATVQLKNDNFFRNRMKPLEIIVDLLRTCLNEPVDDELDWSKHIVSTGFITSLINVIPMISESQIRNHVRDFSLEIRRLLVIDDVLPSYRKAITVVILNAFSNFHCRGWLSFHDPEFSLDMYHFYMGCQHPLEVRETAWQCLLDIYSSPKMELDKYRVKLMNILDRILEMVQNRYEHPYVKHRFLQIMIRTINIESTIKHIDMLPTYTHWNGPKSPLKSFLHSIRLPHSENRDLVDLIWKSLIVSRDIRLKNDLRKLYFALWGDFPPYCYMQQAHIDREYTWDTAVYDRDLVKNSKEVTNDTLPKRIIMQLNQENPLDAIPKDRPMSINIANLSNRRRKSSSSGAGPTKVRVGETPLPISKAVFPTTNPQQVETSMVDDPPAPYFSKEIREDIKEWTTKLRARHGVLPNLIHLRDTLWLAEMHFTTKEKHTWVVQVELIKDLHTSKVIYNRLPFPPAYVQKAPGLKWFKLDGLTSASSKNNMPHPDAIYPEKQIRKARCKQQLVYWIGGQSALIGHDKTAGSDTSKYSVFLEKCNHFGNFLYQPKMFHRVKELAYFFRCQRVLLSIPKFDLICDLDIYDTPVGRRFLKTLPLRTVLSCSNRLQIFSLQKTIELSEEEKRASSSYKSKELRHGEVTLWGNQNICMGTGDNILPTNRSGNYTLLEPCFVFGRIVSNLDILADIKVISSMYPNNKDSLEYLEMFIFERVLTFTIHHDKPIHFKVTMYQNQVADLLYESFRVSKSSEFKMEVSSTSAFLFIPLPLATNKFIEPTQDIVSFGEWGLWHEPNRKIGDRVQSLVFPFGDKKDESHNLRLPTPCSLWGSIQSNLKELHQQLKQLPEGTYNITLQCENAEKAAPTFSPKNVPTHLKPSRFASSPSPSSTTTTTTAPPKSENSDEMKDDDDTSISSNGSIASSASSTSISSNTSTHISSNLPTNITLPLSKPKSAISPPQVAPSNNDKDRTKNTSDKNNTPSASTFTTISLPSQTKEVSKKSSPVTPLDLAEPPSLSPPPSTSSKPVEKTSSELAPPDLLGDDDDDWDDEINNNNDINERDGDETASSDDDDIMKDDF